MYVVTDVIRFVLSAYPFCVCTVLHFWVVMCAGALAIRCLQCLIRWHMGSHTAETVWLFQLPYFISLLLLLCNIEAQELLPLPVSLISQLWPHAALLWLGNGRFIIIQRASQCSRRELRRQPGESVCVGVFVCSRTCVSVIKRDKECTRERWAVLNCALPLYYILLLL